MTAYAFTMFGPDDESWNIDAAGEAAGAPGIGLICNAVQVWSLCQEGSVTVAMAAAAFRCPETLIREAIEWHPWMFLDGDVLGHEGE